MSTAGCGPVITKSFPVPLKSFDCLTKLVNVYGAWVGLHSILAVAETLTDLPGPRLRFRSWITLPGTVGKATVPVNGAWSEEIAGALCSVMPVGTEMFAEPSSCGLESFVSVIFTVGCDPALASAAGSAGTLFSGTAGKTVMAAWYGLVVVAGRAIAAIAPPSAAAAIPAATHRRFPPNDLRNPSTIADLRALAVAPARRRASRERTRTFTNRATA